AEYDAVFIGRFHAQKGAVELIDIWKKVCARKNGSRLAMIGAGPLETVIRKKIGEYNLEKNISFFGFLDGIPKLEVFKKSRMVLHPAIYDSGGMAACEAMACGLPGVSFDLPALKTYYPQGMLKTACFDFEAFAANILRLLYDETLYQKLSCEALALVRENWDWNKRAEDIWNEVFKIKSPE
ncbi:MAG TPA: hypothetical protein DC049_04250, partial [Spirochaetia bacterium]|nr:hypothetical protein [Spirochaetia bacterium]